MTTTTTHVYGPERKAADVRRPDGPAGPRPVVLLWHSRGPDEREVLAPLGGAATALGVLVGGLDLPPAVGCAERTAERLGCELLRLPGLDHLLPPRAPAEVA
ncbi:hypothetical protein [Kitasatospora cineracea]|uniref:hypothetical protein n=1 Tax=Kitasatospora cineracea TaxID=88074 RepID=UPI00378EF096